MKTITVRDQKISLPETFTATKFLSTPVQSDTSKFVYGYKRSAKMAAVCIKGNISSTIAVVIENSNEIITPLEAIALLKMPENKDKAFDLNTLSFQNSCFHAITFLRY